MQMSSLATTRTFFIGTALGLIGMLAVAGTAIADSSLALDVDDAKLVSLVGEPSTVVISNPMFADASIQGNKLIVIGKNTGRTKVIVLDLDGNLLANVMVKVQRAEDSVVSVYRAGIRRTSSIMLNRQNSILPAPALGQVWNKGQGPLWRSDIRAQLL